MSGDPFERLSVLNPFADEFAEYTDADEALLVRIVASPPVCEDPRPRRRRGRRWWLVGGVGAAVVLTAAFAVLRRDQVSNPIGALCYRVADVDGDRSLVEFTDDPVGACGAPWSDGTFATDGAPPLVGCVNEAGVATVFPGDESICSRLGLAELENGLGDDEGRLVALLDTMSTLFAEQCFRQPEALAKADELLDASGLDGWTVELAENFPPGRECAFATPMAESKSVIVGGARPAP